MFALTKQQRTKRLLMKHCTNSITVTETLETAELTGLERADYLIARAKTAAIFDELKVTYNNFNAIKYMDELWKTEKPLDSEGMVFRLHTQVNILGKEYWTVYKVQNISEYLKQHPTYRKLHGNTTVLATPLLGNVILVNIRKDVLEKSKRAFKSIATYSDTAYLIAYILYNDIKDHNIALAPEHLGLPSDLLALVAKYAKTNIIQMQG